MCLMRADRQPATRNFCSYWVTITFRVGKAYGRRRAPFYVVVYSSPLPDQHIQYKPLSLMSIIYNHTAGSTPCFEALQLTLSKTPSHIIYYCLTYYSLDHGIALRTPFPIYMLARRGAIVLINAFFSSVSSINGKTPFALISARKFCPYL
jgi:hypothetical protein